MRLGAFLDQFESTLNQTTAFELDQILNPKTGRNTDPPCNYKQLTCINLFAGLADAVMSTDIVLE